MSTIRRSAPYQRALKDYHTRELFVALAKFEAKIIELSLDSTIMSRPRRWRESEWALTLAEARRVYTDITDQKHITAFDLDLLLGHLARYYKLVETWTPPELFEHQLREILDTFTRLRGVVRADKDIAEFLDVCAKEVRAKRKAKRAIRKARRVIAKAEKRLK